jgi:hypothetical protein
VRRSPPVLTSERRPTYETKFGDEPAQKGVNYSEEGNQYFGRLEDDGLVFEGPARFRHELDDEGGVRTNPDGTITVD